jgi:UDP-glucuronate 4-epimerase
MHVFITGGAGFIGSHTTEHLLNRGDTVSILDAFNFGYDPKLKERNATLLQQYDGCKLYRGDIRDKNLLDTIFSDKVPDVVVHLAARAGVRPSLIDPASYSDININGTIQILETMRKYGVQQMVFASSSSVYGARNKGPFREDDLVDIPVSPYAATKRAGELICATYNHLYNMDISCLRFFTVYGPRQRPEMAIHLFANKISKGEEITMFGDGSSLRDYTFVKDIVKGVVASIDKPLGYKIINLGNCSPIRLDHLIDTIAKVVGKKAIITQLPDQPGDVPMTFAEVSKAEKLLGYSPDTPIEVGLHAFVQWLEKQSDIE